MLTNEADKRISVTEMLEYMKNNFRISSNNEAKCCDNCVKIKASIKVLEKENEVQANETQKNAQEVSKLSRQVKELKEKNLQLADENEKLKMSKAETGIKKLKLQSKENIEITNELREYNFSVKIFNFHKRDPDKLFIINRFMSSGYFYRVKNVKKLKTSTSTEHKKMIKQFLSKNIPNTDLSKLFFNLGKRLLLKTIDIL
jgi:predicted RNase H-like nuclease (RuvC/YqgF family)